MAGRRLCLLLVLLLGFSLTADAIYQDQLGTWDWQQQYIGKVHLAVFPPGPAKRRCYVATEAGVVAGLNLRTGELGWRQVLDEDDRVDAMALQEDALLTLSRSGTRLRSWLASTGDLGWERAIELEASSSGTSRPSCPLLLLPVASDLDKDGVPDLLLGEGGSLQARAGLDGALLWSAELGDAACAYDLALEGERVTAAVLSSDDIWSLLSIELDTGRVLERRTQAATGEAPEDVRLLLMDKGAKLVALEPDGTAIQSGKSRTALAPALAGTVRAFLAPQEGLPAAVASLEQAVDHVILRVASLIDGKLLLQERTPIARVHYGAVQALFVSAYSRKDGGGPGFRAVAVTADHSLLLMQQGEVVWRREEALASVQAAQFVDLPARRIAGSAAGPAGPTLGAWLRGQLLQLKSQLKMATPDEMAELATLRRRAAGKNVVLWDKAGFRKLLVVLTASGKTLALHNGDGRVLWARYEGDVAGQPLEQDALLVWDTPHTLESAPQLLLIGQAEAGGGMAIWLDAHTGAQLRRRPLRARPTAVLDLGAGAPTAAAGARTVLVVYPDHVVEAVDESGTAGAWARAARELYYHELDATKRALRGWGLRVDAAGRVMAQEVWRASFGPGERVVAVASRPRDEVVHSQVRVLGDRSVLYKYLNPNLLLVAVETPAASSPGGTDLLVQLMDAVTGHVLYQVRHASGRGPAHAALTENWAVYSFWNAIASRVELCSLELYDDVATRRPHSVPLALQAALLGANHSAVASSMSPPAIRVLGQSYFLQHGVSLLTPTVTARGITPRQMLVGTPAGQLLALDRRLLDPRRPHQPTTADREEGLIQYSDTMPLMPSAFATYDRAMPRLRRVVAAPARLESTSHLLAFGLDLFYTRVTPSRSYDLLTDDFSYGMLLATIVLLVVATAVSQRMVSSKDLFSKWR